MGENSGAELPGNKKGENNMFKKWLKASAVRAGKTFCQTAVSMLTVGQAVIEINWINVLSVSLVAALISILTSIAGLPEVKGSSEG